MADSVAGLRPELHLPDDETGARLRRRARARHGKLQRRRCAVRLSDHDDRGRQRPATGLIVGVTVELAGLTLRWPVTGTVASTQPRVAGDLHPVCASREGPAHQRRGEVRRLGHPRRVRSWATASTTTSATATCRADRHAQAPRTCYSWTSPRLPLRRAHPRLGRSQRVLLEHRADRRCRGSRRAGASPGAGCPRRGGRPTRRLDARPTWTTTWSTSSSPRPRSRARLEELPPTSSGLRGQDLLIVGILRGAVMVMADLARAFAAPPRDGLDGGVVLRLGHQVQRRGAHPQGPATPTSPGATW